MYKSLRRHLCLSVSLSRSSNRGVFRLFLFYTLVAKTKRASADELVLIFLVSRRRTLETHAREIMEIVSVLDM